ncbi:MAG: alanine racemase [Planctomycetota bacterium]
MLEKRVQRTKVRQPGIRPLRAVVRRERWQHPVTARIDLSAIIHNCKILREITGGRCRLCAAVKCNAYGHGTEVVLPAFKIAQVEMLCVATLCEASELRRLGWDGAILLLGSELSICRGQEKQEAAEWVVENELRITAVNFEEIQLLASAAMSVGKEAFIHLMLDTGMSRMGLDEKAVLGLVAESAKNNRWVVFEGLYTHFATADESDKGFAEYQLKRFNDFVEKISLAGCRPSLIHSANSAAAIDMCESHFNMIRPGISVYGYHSSKTMRNKPELRPSMKVVSYLTLVKHISAGSYIGYGCTYKAPSDMVIALVPVGYGDGYDRRLSNKGVMNIEGWEVPVVGRVSMDQTIIDVTALVKSGLDVQAGQEVVVIDNNREAKNSVESLSAELETIPYEIVTRIGQRVKRTTV